MERSYWQKRWNDGTTTWDIGYPSPPIVSYLEKLKDKSIRILIPGAGNAYEAEYLYQNGFTNTFIIDFSEIALESFKKRCPQFPLENIFHQDFFNHDGDYDIIIEQTFFCAIHPSKRIAYLERMNALLKPEGILLGLLFNDPDRMDGPPFGGSIEIYEPLFSKYMSVVKMELANNSIKPRIGRELFFISKRLD